MAGVVYREVYPMSPFEARKRLVQTCQQTGSVRRTAALWHTSRQVVRKRVRRYEQDGEDGLHDRSCRPHHCPHQTREATEEPGRRGTESHRLWARTPGPLSRSARGPGLSPYHPSHPASSSLTREKHKRRKPLYPAHWAWNVKEPFALIQTDAKDILDKGALETRRWQHIRTQHLPRYQWTACDGRTRLHFLAYSHNLNRTNGGAFMVLVFLWVRAHGVGASVTFQTDWGEEFGGDNQEQIQKLGARFLAPLHGTLCRYPMCRKGYHGRVERSHRTDDEEFYHPYLLQIGDTPSFLSWAARWAYFYNVLRPHFGSDMGRRTPLAMLKELGYHGREHIAVLPPILLDAVSTDLLMACDAENGNDLLAFYRTEFAVVTRNR